jgi:GNAT superfamily N-acetyltransferase
MPKNPNQEHPFTFHPLTPERWNDFEALFGPRGACGGCWCMWWRIKRSDFDHQKGDANRLALQQIVASGEVPGLLAYYRLTGGPPVGWCSVAPRDAFPALERSRILKRVDDQPVWSAVCFFIAKTYRRQGLTISLLRAAVEYARQAGAKIVEGYPEDPRKAEIPAPFAFTGLASAFFQAGFVEVLRRSETRPIMRYYIE